MAISNHPIFIIGVHRSGTTLLRYMLISNPRIYIPPESDFIPYFFGRNPTERLSDRRISRLLQKIFNRYRFVNEWVGDPPSVQEFIQRMPDRTPTAFLDTLYRSYAQQYEAVRWGDKTPIYTSYVELIHQLFPKAQFIHIIRDGRDVALSMLDQWGKTDFHIDLYYTARNWVRRIQQAQRSGAVLGKGLFHELSYENLVNDPEGELRALCRFLGEEYLTTMAEPHRLGRERIEPDSFHASIRRPPTSKRIGRWRTEMSNDDLRLFQHITGDLLGELGYPIVDLGQMSPREKARLAFGAAKYKFLQSGRRTLQALGLFPPI